MQTSKRRFMVGVPLALAAGLGTVLMAGAGVAAAKPKERVIKIEARKFRYAPNLIELKKGEAVVLEFRAIDFTHGFSIPEMKVRADLLQGQVVRVKLQPDTAGQFGFLCDNFCGSGHEEMAGSIIVKEA
ncbi:cupredoxin domain-containing protein [Rugamonas sp.]|uniref:cupredoxin domain-containing protein n=1 Tax=Rugamonas sp. TaxID=1926287 RepID=UPI0025DEEECD|nr:cupredoxin domain-containing protein [Rugamonas sp.]